MNLQRWMAIFTTAAYATLTMAITNNTWPAWTKYLALAACFFGTLVHYFTPEIQTSNEKLLMRKQRLPLVPPSVMMFFLFAFACLMLCFVYACASLPKPTGVDVSAIDGGVQTCIDWARQNPKATCKACGDYLADAGSGL